MLSHVVCKVCWLINDEIKSRGIIILNTAAMTSIIKEKVSVDAATYIDSFISGTLAPM
jgi:hypothetical protein